MQYFTKPSPDTSPSEAQPHMALVCTMMGVGRHFRHQWSSGIMVAAAGALLRPDWLRCELCSNSHRLQFQSQRVCNCVTFTWRHTDQVKDFAPLPNHSHFGLTQPKTLWPVTCAISVAPMADSDFTDHTDADAPVSEDHCVMCEQEFGQPDQASCHMLP